LTDKLTNVTEIFRKLMMHDTATDTTVTAIDGTSFSPDVYLKVTPVNTAKEKANFMIASENVDKQKDSDPILKDKELVALYDVSMFKGNEKIQPDGRVQVKIKIPDNLKMRDGLNIIHISDEGTVTNMQAKREGDYLVFITDHFSQYGIVAKDNCLFGICKALGQYDAAKGICYDWIYISAGIIILTLTTLLFIKKRKTSP
jgi:hypothetical protein